MPSKKLLIAQLTPAERQVIVDAIRDHDIVHKEIILELFSFVETLLENLKNSKITMSVLKAQLMGFISEQTKKAHQTK
jgi:ribosome-binding ATPase YchF (GTP1/OBG family)